MNAEKERLREELKRLKNLKKREIEQKLQSDLIIHPVKLGRLSDADRQRLDAAMMK